MHYEFIPKGVCSTRIEFDLDGGVIRSVHFEEGCDGNLQAISRLVAGMSADQVRTLLSGISCDGSGTSCADQLAKALSEALERAEQP
ncbi:MAG: TIGR03905 family TSCPD domain-containing protein [Christensenellales bacterium]|jgi:uncharacterized protein (TIGR03905 family)